MKVVPLALTLLGLAAWGQTAAEAGRQLRELTLDPQQCYRVRELSLPHEDLKLYFTEGYLIFSRPVAGRVVAAVFSGEIEGGDAEVLLMPPDRGERMSLASFLNTPNLNEHFNSALLLFTDDSGDELLRQIEAGSREKSEQQGQLLAGAWNPVLQNLAGSFQVRMVRDLLAAGARRDGVFFAAVKGRRYGNFDLVYDPASPEQITAGQVVYRQDHAYFDVWTSFKSRAFRMGQRSPAEQPAQLADFRIDATIGPDLGMEAVTRFKLTARAAGLRAVLLQISRKMAVTAASIDGDKAEVFERESVRDDLLRHDQNHTFLLVAARSFEPGRQYEVEIRHQGAVIADAGNGVYFVGDQGGWYPRIGFELTTFDMLFRYPKSLNLVATGEVAEDRTEADTRVTHVRSGVRIRMAGFNLGRFDNVEVRRGEYTVELHGSRFLDRALDRRPEIAVIPPRPPSRRMPQILAPAIPAPVAVHNARLRQMAEEIADAFQFMAERLGPPPLRRLTGSPIPGSYGQGYPGLLYLPTLYYLDPGDRPAGMRQNPDVTLFLQLLGPHETAHQWWGNAVSVAGYHDGWLMEALANYTALLYAEKTKGKGFIDAALDLYRQHLLRKTGDGRTVESIGPITAGRRLEIGSAPDAWRIITYEKGSWILHMLRHRMGDTGFRQMLAALVKKYQLEPLTTEALRQQAEAHLPPKSRNGGLDDFFDSWVHGTGIPMLQLDSSIQGKAGAYQVTGSVRQSGVNADFSTAVPVEIQFLKAKPVTRWVETSSEPARFKITVRQQPTRVLLDPGNSVLAIRK